MSDKIDWQSRAARAAGRDITASRHRGNPESRAAFKCLSPYLKPMQRNVYAYIIAAGKYGITCKELAHRWECGMNEISGRFTELKKMGAVLPAGRRDGSGVVVAACYAGKEA